MHPEEFLVYDLEIITWFHGGKLKFGCLFDEETVGEDVISRDRGRSLIGGGGQYSYIRVLPY